jgi:hypothetical protein
MRLIEWAMAGFLLDVDRYQRSDRMEWRMRVAAETHNLNIYETDVAGFNVKLVSNSFKKFDDFHLVWSLSDLFTLCYANGCIAMLLPIKREQDDGYACMSWRRGGIAER